jgi:putative thioredoxin
MDITLTNFEAELIQGSTVQPVLLDIWAEWCGPCKALGPVLEKLEGDYAGRFKLAKLDADKVPELAQQLSQMFGVRSIPFCVMFAGGQPVDGFVGAIPEAQIREFLDKHVPSEAEVEAEADAQAAHELADSGDTKSALAKLSEALAINPANDEARWDYVKLLLDEGNTSDAPDARKASLEQAIRAFEPLAAKSSKLSPVPRTDALGAYLGACMAAPHARAPEALQAAITANKRDFAARFELAQTHFAHRQFEAALDELLEIVMRDKAWNEGAARSCFVAILELLTPAKKPAAASNTAAANDKNNDKKIALTGHADVGHKDADAALVANYRRQLSMVLF